MGAAAGPGRDHRGDMGPRVAVPVLLRGPVEEPGPDSPARAQDGCLQAHTGPRDAVVLRAEHRWPDGDNERRREPTREVPRPRGERPAAGGYHRDSGQRNHVLPRPRGRAPRNHTRPRDSRRVLPVPEEDRGQVHRGPKGGGRAERHPEQQPPGDHHDQVVHRRGAGGQEGQRRIPVLPGRQQIRH